MSARLLPGSTGVAACALALGFALGGVWTWTLFILAFAGLWLLGQWRGWGWIASLGLIFFVGTAAGGLWLGLAVSWMFLGAVAALVAWDLHHFVQRLRSVGGGETQAARCRELEQSHLRRLLIVQGLGVLLAAVALGVKIDFGFGAAFLLGLLAVLGLGRAVAYLRRESD